MRANVKSWNILDIPAYENYLTIYWNNAYELGGCSATRSGVIVQNKNTKSKNYNVHYICKATSWQKATDYEKDTYQWADGKDGEFKKGNVTETYYVFENGSWSVAKNETALGLCTEARNGEIGKIDTTYFICDSKNWRKATVLEYDTYQFGAGNDGEVRTGKVNENKYYVYENGVWRASASEIENNLGACVTSRLNEVGKSENTYYTCKTSGWTKSTALEYDTYGWEAGTEGAVKPGSVNTSNHYVFENGAWRASKNDVEYNYGACVTIRESEKHPLNGKYHICENKAWKEISATEYGLGYCTTAKNGAVEKLNNVYYICKSEKWNVATVLEYDTYGKTCLTDGTIVSGEVETSNKYVCDANSFRVANEQEISLDKGCVSYTENEEIRKQISDTQDSIYTCKSSLWAGSVGNHIVYGTLTDPRDGKTYKTVVIGTQTWMAENLNYEISDSWCYGNEEENCEKYGRLYTWAAAMSAVPDGWHLPTNEEWVILATNVGGEAYAGTKLKSKNGWNSGNGTDDYGFSVFPAGYRYSGFFINLGSGVYFWTASESSSSNAYNRHFNTGASMSSGSNNKTSSAYSVRLVKDSE